MELTNKKTEPVVATTNENLPTPNKLVATSKVEQVKSFRAYAFEKAGLNGGDSIALKTYLKWIKTVIWLMKLSIKTSNTF